MHNSSLLDKTLPNEHFKCINSVAYLHISYFTKKKKKKKHAAYHRPLHVEALCVLTQLHHVIFQVIQRPILVLLDTSLGENKTKIIIQNMLRKSIQALKKESLFGGFVI
jgi:hypothetical protein